MNRKKGKKGKSLTGGPYVTKKESFIFNLGKKSDRQCLGTTVELSQFQTDHGHPLRGLPHMHWQGLG